MAEEKQENKPKARFNWPLKPTSTPNFTVKNAFTNEEMDKIIEIGKSRELKKGQVAGGLLTNVRVTDLNFLPTEEEYKWIFRKLSHYINDVNTKYFRYELTEIQNLQFGVYRDGGFYDKHIDEGYGQHSSQRKLSFVLMLTDPKEYVGGDLLLYTSHKGVKPSHDRGSLIFFPSYTLHEVTPVTEGERITLVGWVMGPLFK